MKAELVPENGDFPIRILRDISIVGRREYCDIRIDHPTISKRHCILVKTSGLLILRDMATTNGTKVKGQRVRWAALLPGDKVSIGGYKVRVYLGPDEAPSPSDLATHGSGYSAGFAEPTPQHIEIPSDVRGPQTPSAAPPSYPPRSPEPIHLGEEDLIDEGVYQKYKFDQGSEPERPFIIDLD